MRVAKIEYSGKASVFNMEVEGTHSFIVNGGIVSHNCYDESRYLCMARPITPKRETPVKGKAYDPFVRRGEEDFE